MKGYHSSQSNHQTNEIALPDANVLNVDRSCLKYLADAILCIASTPGNQPQAIELMLYTGSAFSVLPQFTYNALEACCFLSLGYIYVRN